MPPTVDQPGPRFDPRTLTDDDRRRFMALGMGRSLPFWRRVVSLQLDRLEQLEQQYPAVRDHFAENVPRYALNNPVMNQWNLKVQADSHFLVIAIGQVMKYGKFLQDLARGSDPRAGRLLGQFDSKWDDPKGLRNFLEHFDRYSVGRKPLPKGPGPGRLGFDVNYNGEHVILEVGNWSIALVPLAKAAAELASGLDALWLELMQSKPASELSGC